jgi:hypothetical protein
MPVNIHSSQDQQVSSGQRWTGVANMVVASINPSMDELKAAGLNPQKEPEYIKDEIGEALGAREGGTFKKHRLDVNLYHPEHKFYAKMAIFLESRLRYNKDGNKVGWINKYGLTAWSADEQTMPNYPYFKLDMARVYYVGEDVLTDFIKNWANCGPNDQAILDDPKKLVEGDLTELKTLWKQIANNQVQVLLGVNRVEKDGKVNYYQAVYTGHFNRPYNRNMAAWRNALNAPFGAFKADYQDDLVLKPFTGDTRVESDKPSDLAAQSSFGSFGAPTGQKDGGYTF